MEKRNKVETRALHNAYGTCHHIRRCWSPRMYLNKQLQKLCHQILSGFEHTTLILIYMNENSSNKPVISVEKTLKLDYVMVSLTLRSSFLLF